MAVCSIRVGQSALVRSSESVVLYDDLFSMIGLALQLAICLAVSSGIDWISLLNEIIHMCTFNSFTLQKPSCRLPFPASEH